uniref:Lysozyme g n=1 Tax=Gopherus evgoodei TaxID=1825980 RepID=A0A8C4YPZ3_9SAUR
MLLTLMILGLAALFGTSESQTGCFGNINNVDATGASCKTAGQEGLDYCGGPASEKIAERDLNNMNKYKAIIKNAGKKKCVDPAVIADHLLDATQILIDMIKGIQKKFPRWTKEQQLKGGISAYNGGLGNVRSYENMDKGTPGNDYANDVVARAKFYKRNGY